MLVCIKLIDRLQSQYYEDEAYEVDPTIYIKKHPKEYKETKRILTDERDLELDFVAFYIGHLKKEKAKRLLFKILETKIETWWE